MNVMEIPFQHAAIVPGDAGAPGLVAVSHGMEESVKLAKKLAATELPVTILGETGSGKGLLARLVHASSARSNGPFVTFESGAWPERLLEAELFGGTATPEAGALAAARGGTLFVNDIEELPLDLQLRLVRVLDSGAGRRSHRFSHERPADLRLVAASSADLSTLVASKRFRRDLYFRLAAAVVRLPALRDRPEDLPVLVNALLHDLKRPDVQVPPETIERLKTHTWPGNVRELKNTLSCALAFAENEVLAPQHIRFVEVADQQRVLERLPLAGQSLQNLERVAIRQTLSQLRGNKILAARTLGIAPSTLYEKLKRYGL